MSSEYENLDTQYNDSLKSSKTLFQTQCCSLRMQHNNRFHIGDTELKLNKNQ